MMAADLNLQVWLETGSSANPGMIIPYVKAPENKTLQYRLHTVKSGKQGRTVMNQSGTVTAQANVATPLVRMSVTRSAQDECHVEIVISDGHAQEKSYSFQCPTPSSS